MPTEMTKVEVAPLAVNEILKIAATVQEILNHIMVRGVHYAPVPGCGDKPVLLLPGAEKILMAFRISAECHVNDLSTPTARRYQVTLEGIGPNGERLGVAAVGSASTDETKYAWRATVCDAEYEASDRKRIKFSRDGRQEKQVATNPADLDNTVLKMAHKRALVQLARSIVAGSDCFQVDIEENAEGESVGLKIDPQKQSQRNDFRNPAPVANPPRANPPRANAAPAQPRQEAAQSQVPADPLPEMPAQPAPARNQGVKPIPAGHQFCETKIIECRFIKESPPDEPKPWALYGIKTKNGDFTTFSQTVAEQADQAAAAETMVRILFQENDRGRLAQKIEFL